MQPITRREFHRRTGTMALAAAGFATAARSMTAEIAKPRERPNILYGLSTGSWGRVVKPGEPSPLLEILDETAAAGFNGVRLTGFPAILERNNLTEEQYGEELKRRGLRFSTVSFGGPFLDETKHDEILASARRVLDLHRRHGATAAVFFPPKPVPESEEDEALGVACRFFNRMGKLAVEEYGIRMGLHNHTDSLVENQRQVDQFLDRTDPRYVYCAWDTAHLHLGGCDVEETFRKSLERIVYTDFKDATRHPVEADYLAPNGERYAGDSHAGRFFNSITDMGQGEIDFVPLMKMLKEQQYRGWINHDLDTIRVSCAESWRIAMTHFEEKLDPIYQ